MISHPGRGAAVAGVLACVLGAAPAPAPAQELGREEWQAALDQYEEHLRRLPFLWHTWGRQRFARTGDPRARDLLIRSYARPTKPEDFVRYSLASIVTESFQDAGSVEPYADWRRRFKKKEDAWLWYRTLVVHRRHAGPADLAEIALDKGDAFVRAAALEALASNVSEEGLAVIPALLDDLPRKDKERIVLFESLVACLEANGRDTGSAAFQAAARPLILTLDDEDFPERSKLTLLRALGRIFHSDSLVARSEPWLRQLEAGRNASPPRSTVEYATFFGLQATGNRICYVIDMSDSMTKLLEGQQRTGPTTGGRPKKPKGKDADELIGPDGLPWWKISDRFDLAREQLKLSLSRLGPNRSFCVIWFGDEAGLLESTRGMIPATASNIARVEKELDAIVAGPPTDTRPDGTLRGKTNLHGGLRRAFMVTERGLVERAEYVDTEAALEGADTIFLLSDGAPTWDDWPCDDQDYGEIPIGDPESGIRGGSGNIKHYFGPYRMPEFLLDDLRRLNLFRKVEIHCVGIGEADWNQLQQIAKIGHGKLHRVGASGRRP